MATFSHSSFRTYKLDDLPLKRDIFTMDEIYADELEAEAIIDGRLGALRSART